MKDRRGENRVPAMTPVIVEVDSGEAAAVTEDMSERGMRLRSAIPLPVGSTCRVRFNSRWGGAVIETSGTVVRAYEESRESLFEYGAAIHLVSPVPARELPATASGPIAF